MFEEGIGEFGLTQTGLDKKCGKLREKIYNFDDETISKS
jgi:hypothetical protein